MARALRIEYPGAFYHVTCRGNEQRRIFIDPDDQKIFFERLILSLDIYNVILLAYVCMSNHFHFLLTTPEGNLSQFMRHFNISYTSVFNRRHRRVGHLYQGRYKAFLVDADNYLLAVSRYIHLNPMRTKAYANKSVREQLECVTCYRSSSLSGYFSMRERDDFVNYSVTLEYMGGDNRGGRAAYRRFISSGIDQDIEDPKELGKGSGIIGSEDFIDWIKERFLGDNVSPREQPAAKELKRDFEPLKLIEIFVRLTGSDRKDLCRKGKNSFERAMIMELLYRHCNVTQPEIGKLLGGIDYSAVSQARKRFRIKLEHDRKLRKKFESICEHLSRLKI